MSINWKNVLYYDPSSPTGLRWKIKHQNKSVGDIAGSFQPDGYARVQYLGTRWGCHRVVWYIHRQYLIDNLEIDHIDGHKGNNRIENLRLVSRTINSRNNKIAASNTSGTTGVVLNQGSWLATWKPPCGKHRGKRFSINKYGNDEAFRLASEYRAEKVKEMNANGAGYSERHGT